MNPILCALDLTPSSKHSMRVALEMANQYKTKVIGLFAYRLVQPATGTVSDYRKSVEKQAKDDFEQMIRQMNFNGSVNYEFRSEIGFLTDRIDDYLHKSEVGMLVMSQDMADSINEHKGLSLQHFIHSLKVPLLIVPQGAEAKSNL